MADTTSSQATIIKLDCRHEADVAKAMEAAFAQEALVRGAWVLSHVQAFADALADRGLASSFGTYPGHQPTIDRAIDIFVPVNDRSVGDSICEFALENWERFGGEYIMFAQHINSNDGRGWRRQSPFDRGSITANHYDHVHWAARARVSTPPIPPPTEEDDLTQDQANTLMYIAQVVTELKRPFESAGGGDFFAGLEKFAKLLEGVGGNKSTPVAGTYTVTGQLDGQLNLIQE